MRLSSKETKAIVRAFSACLQGVEYKLYLFGSRIDDAKKGGDIDLLIIVPKNLKSEVIDLKGKIRSQIFELIPEQKIDITVATNEEMELDIFLGTIAPKAVLLSEQRTSQ